MTHATPVHAFIDRWQGVTASELSTAQTFVIELCDLLGVAKPHPTPAQDYMFERPVTFTHGDGSTSAGRIDCYRRGHFVLEAKKQKAGRHTKGYDDGLLRARSQGEGYARALPAGEGRPPFLLVVDVGQVIEVYAEFSRSGGTYTPFPDPRSHRIALADLTQPGVLDRLRLIWTDPDALDPARISAQVTREVSRQLAKLARSLEQAGHSAHDVAAYLSRCLFSMFAEDVELLPKGSFHELLKQHRDDPATLQQMLRILWADMDRGGFTAALAKPLLRFNGKLFKGSGEPGYSLRLTGEQIDWLIEAAKSNWREVEPAIFGTLLERALDPDERHALGAHYTPRAYVERLVLPTVIEPLRAEWADAQAAALTLAREAAELEANPPEVKTKKDFAAQDRHNAAVRAKWRESREQVKAFLHRLCTLRVLDPACGSGNFLYVTLEHLKRLEGEVLNQLTALGEAQEALDLGRETVTLQQLRGIELNERAATLAELVLWIGFLQWQIRTSGRASVAEPVVHDYGNIEHRDAVLAWDRQEPMRDEAGDLVTRWDGETFKVHPVTGAMIPDDAARVPQWRYVEPRPADWPTVDFIVGNPPFIGGWRLRQLQGDGYVEALWSAYPHVPQKADYVMYWWDRAADHVRSGRAKRFGLITTNSITQVFQRRVVSRHLGLEGGGISIRYAIPDHPWIDSSNGAAVRIAMTVAAAEPGLGVLAEVVEELESSGDASVVRLRDRRGAIHADLRIGANLSEAVPLRSNSGVCSPGVQLYGAGFVIDRATRDRLSTSAEPLANDRVLRPYVNARDLTQRSRDYFVIDFFGLTRDEAMQLHPAAFQHVLNHVKPERDVNRRESIRSLWWRFGWERPALRSMVKGLSRFIVTAETSKHRVFQFLPGNFLPDNRLTVIASDDAYVLGVLTSSVHVIWSLSTGGTLEDRPIYTKSRCFDPFPFPDLEGAQGDSLRSKVSELAERLNSHRDSMLAANPELTLTGIYNVLNKLREGQQFTLKDRQVHDAALIGVLRTLHDELDLAVLEVYGWADLAQALGDLSPGAAEVREVAVNELLQRLVSLNGKRVVEEASGTTRWLRSDLQQGRTTPTGEQSTLIVDTTSDEQSLPDATRLTQRSWPAGLTEQIKAVAEVMAQADRSLGLEDIAAHFTARGRWRDRLPTLVDTLVSLGRLRPVADGRWVDVRH